MLSSLPCVPAFYRSAIPTSHILLILFADVYVTGIFEIKQPIYYIPYVSENSEEATAWFLCLNALCCPKEWDCYDV